MRTALTFAITVLLSFALDAVVLPRATWRRAPLAVLIHVLSVLFLYALFLLLSARPVFSGFCVLALLALLVMSSNSKFQTMREPFVFSDLALNAQLFRHPRLYLPFLGVRELGGTVVGAVVLVLGCWAEPPVAFHPWLLLALAAACLVFGRGMTARLPLTLDACQDQRRYGFFTVFTAYLVNGLSVKTVRALQSAADAGPFAAAQKGSGGALVPPVQVDGMQPDVIVIQSESYFDVRRVGLAVNPSAYTQLDRVRRESFAWGQLSVPAWGANTMRSEFALLSGLAMEALGYARFYPYIFLRRVCATLPGWFKRRGYRTLALHPYYADFFQRERVFPLMQFDRFLDITHFDQAPRAGPYVADAAVADAVFAALDETPQQGPHFIFAATMEKHGPLHLEQVLPGEAGLYHTLGEDSTWQDLTAYLRHTVNADVMIGNLLDRLRTRSRPTVVCFYGDHVPGLLRAFRTLGVMPECSDYFIWRNFGEAPAVQQDVPIETLGAMVLTAAMQGAEGH